MPIALACSRGSGNIVTIIPRITAEVSAPPTPCTNRAPISTPWLWESAQNSEAPVNTPRPIRKMRRWPIRSPIRPESSSSPPNAIRYALTTHARSFCEKPRSSWIVGRATLTIVASRTIISIPTQRTYVANQRRRSSTPIAAILTGRNPAGEQGVQLADGLLQALDHPHFRPIFSETTELLVAREIPVEDMHAAV